MRVPLSSYNNRRNRTSKKTSKPKPSVVTAVPPSVPTLMEVDEEEEDFDFIAIDDELTGDFLSRHSLQYDSTPIAMCYPIEGEKQPSNSDVAVGILEEFFFGSNATQKQSATQQQGAFPIQDGSPCSEDGFSSPTSTIPNGMTPACSCPHSMDGLASQSLHKHYYSCHSLPASPAPPKRPSLRQQNSFNSSKRNVSFTDISVREYDVELSDHPSCSYGPPIQLGWQFRDKQTTSVEDYEVTRSPRREVHDLLLSYNARQRRLKQSGYKKKEIKRAQQEVARIKRERLITEFFLPASALDETLEKCVQSVKGFFQFRRKEEAVVCQIHSPQLHRYHQQQ